MLKCEKITTLEIVVYAMLAIVILYALVASGLAGYFLKSISKAFFAITNTFI